MVKPCHEKGASRHVCPFAGRCLLSRRGAISGIPRQASVRQPSGHSTSTPRLLMGIHKALRIIFRDASRGYAWIGAANAAFGGRSALDVMLGGELTDLMRVRR